MQCHENRTTHAIMPRICQILGAALHSAQKMRAAGKKPCGDRIILMYYFQFSKISKPETYPLDSKHYIAWSHTHPNP